MKTRASILAALILCACGGEAGTAPVAPAPPSAPLPATDATPAPAPAARHSSVPSREAPHGALRVYDAHVLSVMPHDTNAFTQGLFFADGELYESTGQRGESVIRRLDQADGTAKAETALPDDIFGEGATAVGDRIVSLSWRAGRGFVHDLRTLEPLATFDVDGEGWGLTYDPARDRLVLSDGTPELRFLDPETYAEVGGMIVTLQGRPLPRLNELEMVGRGADATIFANVWQQDFIVRIDPDTGVVTGVIDVSGLYPGERRANPTDDVPNGIAYDPGADRLVLTGKRWPDLFEIELAERAP